MDQLTAREEPHPSDTNAKKQKKNNKTTETPTKHTPQPAQEQSITSDTNAKKQLENKNTSAIPTELAAQTESSSSKGNFYFITFFFTLSRMFMLFILIIVFLHILCFFTSFTFSVQIGSISSNTDAKKQQGNKNTDKAMDESTMHSYL